jgi:hypothetical protein
MVRSRRRKCLSCDDKRETDIVLDLCGREDVLLTGMGRDRQEGRKGGS